MNTDYLVDSDRKILLEALLKIYNLTSVVNFPVLQLGGWVRC
jgi:hypothetical protein